MAAVMAGLDWLSAQAAVSSNQLALIIAGEGWSYAKLDQRVSALCTQFVGLGVVPGEMVATALPNTLDHICIAYACARLGLVFVPLNTRLTAQELDWQIRRLGCRWVIGEDEAVLKNLAAETRVCLTPHMLWRGEIDTHRPALAQQPNWHGEVPLAILFTSGTSGKPKAAMISRQNVFYNAVGSAARLGSLPTDRWLMCLPLFHIGGLVMLLRACLHGVCVVVHGKFEVEAVSHALDRDDITLVSLVPTMLHRLLEIRHSVPATLRAVLLGGAAASEALLIESERRGVPVATTYGLTEATSQVATTAPALINSKPGTVGTPLLFTQLRIANDSDDTVPTHTVGEICVSGPTVMLGYFDDPSATAGAIQNGELHTGDLGYLGEDGDLWVVQRRSDLIVSGGENVYPAEVEAVIRQHEAVADACVVGLADAVWGQRVAAMVTLKLGVTLQEDALMAFCRARLAGYKLPRTFKFVDALPMTANGKVARAVVQAQMV